MRPPLSVGLPNHGSYFGGRAWGGLLDVAAAAEVAGVDGVTVVDHVVMGSSLDRYPYGRFPGGPDAPWLEPLTTLAAIAAVTQRVTLTTGILISPLRPPALLAKTAATLDALSGGRLVLGVGTGWQQEEYEALGLSWRNRHQLLDDQLAACHALWTGGPVDFDAPTLSFRGIHCFPRPSGPSGIPVWIGGALTERSLARIVRWGSGWIPSPVAGPSAIGDGVRKLRPALKHAGRDAAAVRVRASVRPVRDDRGRIDLTASVAATSRLVEAGGTDLFLSLPDWCPDVENAPQFLEEFVAAYEAQWSSAPRDAAGH